MKIIPVLIACSCIAGNAGAQENQKLRTDDLPPIRLPDIPSRDGFWELFASSLEEYTPTVFESRLHPSRNMQWLLRFENDRDAYRHAIDGAAQNALSRSFSYSARVAFIDSPLMRWIEDYRSIPFTFIRNSIGSVEEEEIQVEGISYHSTEQRWWRRLSESGFRYGIRPLQTSPYVFMSFRIGTSDNPAMFVNLRYRLVDFSKQRAELLYSLHPMPGYSVDIGTSYGFGRSGGEPGVTLKFHRELWNGGTLFIGADAGRRKEFLVGITGQW